MRKLFRSRKALSPVVAAIILIAVTVAVSIAVAAWMGALTFTFMKTEEIKVISMTLDTTANTIAVKIRNVGTSKATVTNITVNGKAIDSCSPVLPQSLDAASETTLTLTCTTIDIKSGYKYRVELLTGSGSKFYGEETAPS